MTATQQNFGDKNGFRGADEESKSMNSGNSFNNKFKNSNKKGHHSTKKKGNYQRRDNEDGLDSHTESDEAVDDKGALF